MLLLYLTLVCMSNICYLISTILLLLLLYISVLYYSSILLFYTALLYYPSILPFYTTLLYYPSILPFYTTLLYYSSTLVYNTPTIFIVSGRCFFRFHSAYITFTYTGSDSESLSVHKSSGMYFLLKFSP